jgi:hypothetical protein
MPCNLKLFLDYSVLGERIEKYWNFSDIPTFEWRDYYCAADASVYSMQEQYIHHTINETWVTVVRGKDSGRLSNSHAGGC